MKIRIEGCTAEELAEYSPYLSLDKSYVANFSGFAGSGVVSVFNDKGGITFTKLKGQSLHLPHGARWVEVSE